MIIILWIGIALVLLYEIWAALHIQQYKTISQMIWAISKRPIIPFVFGVLAGHLFWQG